jgi:hypothetical protein
VIIYTKAQTGKDLEGILSLQKANLPSALSNDEMALQGFVTVVHTLDNLQAMNEREPHIIAKTDEQVIAYLLAMTPASQDSLPVLRPMFQVFESLGYKGKTVSAYHYIVVGQVCVDKVYRGQGVLDNCYQLYKNTFQPNYDFAITEIATRNIRSINAHKRVGFNERHRYIAPNGEEWSIVIWDW